MKKYCSKELYNVIKDVSLCNIIFTINDDCVKVEAYNAALFANQPQTDEDAFVCSSASLTDSRLHFNEAFKYARTEWKDSLKITS